MDIDLDARLAELGLDLPKAAAPVANYAPYARAGGALFVSGQLPMGPDGLAYKGKLGDGVSLEEGVDAARLCALNIVAQANAWAGGDWSKIGRLARLGGFVACAPSFTQHPAVINGASDLMVAIFGDQGKHARAAVGVPSLPLDAAVEIEAVFDLV